jgi:hypothetical protein
MSVICRPEWNCQPHQQSAFIATAELETVRIAIQSAQPRPGVGKAYAFRRWSC